MGHSSQRFSDLVKESRKTAFFGTLIPYPQLYLKRLKSNNCGRDVNIITRKYIS